MTAFATLLASIAATIPVGLQPETHHGPSRPARKHHRQKPLQPALASWYYAAGGPIACGGNSYAMGVANRSLPCGTRVLMCFRRCVDVIVFDRGPYVWPRSWDLSQQVAQAIGFSGVQTVRYRVLP